MYMLHILVHVKDYVNMVGDMNLLCIVHDVRAEQMEVLFLRMQANYVCRQFGGTDVTDIWVLVVVPLTSW